MKRIREEEEEVFDLYLIPFMRYLVLNNGVTLTAALEVVQGR